VKISIAPLYVGLSPPLFVRLWASEGGKTREARD
jgi:hypothetical protein